VATNNLPNLSHGIDPTARARTPLPRGDLTGQVAIVTGGGRGIGRAVAQALAQAGAAVTVASQSAVQLTETVRLIEGAGGRALAVVTDVTQPAAVTAMVETTETQLGPVDLLVNNAGITGPIGPLWDVDPEAWWEVVAVHLRGTFLCTRAVLAQMVARRQGRIINMVGGGPLAPARWSPAMAVPKPQWCA
jgi:NAD(P)-dependent dehydrogenase (short-subunit alcohol dehydrogenase family)